MRKRKATNGFGPHRLEPVKPRAPRADQQLVEPDPENTTFSVAPAAVGAATFVLAFGIDLLSKAIVVAGDHGHLVVYNARAPAFVQRVAMSLAAILVTYLLSRGAAHAGIGRLWGAWVGVGLLVGGVLGNGVSPFLWSRGVPDFINMQEFAWNYADFEISIGLTGGLLSVAVAAVAAYLRDRRLPPVAPVAD